MKAIEIVCESCDVTMKLSEELMQRIDGHAGRVTCKACGSKVGLDARSDELTILYGGRRLEVSSATDVELDEDQVTDPPSSKDRAASIRFSEFPTGEGPTDDSDTSSFVEVKVSMAPPLSDELKRRREQSRAASPTPRSEAERQLAMDAPVPPMYHGREAGDSLTPHTLDEHEDDARLIRLPENFKSSPASSNARDESFRSLYPETSATAAREESELSRRNRERGPRPPQQGQLLRASPSSALASQPDAEPEPNQSSNWVPWALACAAMIGLTFNVATGPKDHGISGFIHGLSHPETEKVGAASSPTASAAVQTKETSVEAPTPESEPPVDEDESKAKETKESRAEQPTVDQKPKIQVAANPANKAPQSGQLKTADANQPTPGVEDAPEPEPVETIPFSPSAAATAMRNAAILASRCRKAGDPSGLASITITFSSSGKVTQATVAGPPFAGTKTGSCIAEQFRRAEVPPFSGKRVTMNKNVTIR